VTDTRDMIRALIDSAFEDGLYFEDKRHALADDILRAALAAPVPPPEPASNEVCIGDPSHQYHSHDDEPEPVSDGLREAAYAVIDITAARTGWEDANAMRDRILCILRAALRKGRTP
jgi:hypothetical protein